MNTEIRAKGCNFWLMQVGALMTDFLPLKIDCLAEIDGLDGMTDELPSDAKLQACIELQVNKAEDITLLTRTIIKDGLARKFKLNPDQKELLNSDPHYKSSIKEWISDALAKRPDVADESGPSSEAKVQSKKTSPKTKSKKVEEEGAGQVSEFSSLEDDEEPKRKKARKSKGSPATGDKETKKTSTSKTTTADSIETKLKKLKNLVMLCGTRKPWKKLFEEAGCPDSDTASDEEKTKARKGQIVVVEKTLLDLGMTQPFTKAKAAEVQKQKEIKQDLEAIQVANKTERSTTRGGNKGRTSKSKTISPEKDDKTIVTPAPNIRKFNQSLAAFAAELNDD